MLSKQLQFIMISALVFYFVTLVQLLRKKQLKLKYTLLWLFSGFIMSVLIIFPKVLVWVAGILEVYEPLNILFSSIIFCIIIILMSLTSIISNQDTKITILAQSLALMDEKMRKVEDDVE